MAIIGSRRATTEGLDRAERCAAELSGRGYTIVSGLAAGIDTAAHTATLATGGRTIAVIGTGHGHVFPPENRELQRQIAATGAVVSQFWPDCRASRESFPQRNAVMSGLAAGTVIVEATGAAGPGFRPDEPWPTAGRCSWPGSCSTRRWAQDLAAQPGVHVYCDRRRGGREARALSDPGALTA